MSRNSKNTRNHKIAKELSEARVKRGPDAEPQNPPRAKNRTKRKAWWQLFRSYSEYIKGGGKKPQREQLEVEVASA